MTDSRIPLVDLVTQCRNLKPEVMAAIEQVVDSAGFILGPQLQQFEKEFAEYCGAKHCIGVANGSEALHLSLRALGIGPGDEVITAGNSFAASALAILHAGATPVLADVNADDYTIDIEAVEAAITPRTRAIIPVHLYGQPARIDELCELAARHGLKVLEDAAQSHGADYRGRRAGSLGDIAGFSFYPGKNLGAFGDGGAIITSDDELADRVRVMRHYGQREKNCHEVVGFNSRLDTLQAAILQVKLKHLDNWSEKRRQVAAKYKQLLSGIPEIVLPQERVEVRHVYHVYVIQHPQRDRLIEHLAEHGIAAGIHYPHPLHHAKPFHGVRTSPHDLPVCSQLSDRIVSLPMYPELTDAMVERIANAVESFAPAPTFQTLPGKSAPPKAPSLRV